MVAPPAISLREQNLQEKYRHLLDHFEPFIISYPANWSAFDLAPLGITIAEERRYTATRLRSRDIVDGLHRLDAMTFGDQDMLMPRWVLFDCGEFPGLVFGFGCPADKLPEYARVAYQVEARPDTFVPLSMWVAIRCAEEGAWFGHNLSSANVMLRAEDRLPGLAILTKALGVVTSRATLQYGATQWSSGSIGLHLRLGEMELLSAYTPAHTHPETLSYRIEVNHRRLIGSLLHGYTPSTEDGDLVFRGDDHDAISILHDGIERGERWILKRIEANLDPEEPRRIHLVRG
ncbi:MAG: hypothetical protein AAGA56_28875 [Myxococcota bacterium]